MVLRLRQRPLDIAVAFLATEFEVRPEPAVDSTALGFTHLKTWCSVVSESAHCRLATCCAIMANGTC